MSNLPNFIIVGAPKSGTTSLYHYLKQHPDVYLPDQKELHYFTCNHLNINSNGPGDKESLSHNCATLEEYEANYSDIKDERAIGDISPSYLYYSDVTEEMFSVLGPVKIVVVLRDPIKKAYSQYIHLLSEKREPLSFYDALMAEQNRIDKGWLDIWRYAESTLYSERVRKYISVFGKEKVKVIVFEDLVRSPDDVMRELFEFLGVDGSFNCDTSTVFNKSRIPRLKMVTDLMKAQNPLKTMLKKIVPERIRIRLRTAVLDLNAREKPEMDQVSVEYLRGYFRDDISDLEELIGKKLNWMN